MKHDTGALRAFLDGELHGAAEDALMAHLAGCPRCRTELDALRSRAAAAELCLHKLPAPAFPPDLDAARARFHRRTMSDAARPARRDLLPRSIMMAKNTVLNPRWRPATIGLAAVLTLALLLSIAPVRNVAADFLGLFRVRKFAAIPIDPAQVARLTGLAEQAEGVLGEPLVLREEGPKQPVAEATEASALAGFTVRVPTDLPNGAQQEDFWVQVGPELRFDVQRTVLEALMQAAGMDTAGLPQTDIISASVDVPTGAHIAYNNGSQRIELFQLPSPQIKVPDGVDLIALSETGFQLLGIPAEEAHRLATTIDWTNTLIIPLPTNVAQAQEVIIDGVAGLLIQSKEDGQTLGGETALLWERDDIVYVLNTRNVDEKITLRIADSLR